MKTHSCLDRSAAAVARPAPDYPCPRPPARVCAGAVLLILALGLFPFRAAAQQDPAPPAEVAATNPPAGDTPAIPAPAVAPAALAVTNAIDAEAIASDTNGLRLNFRNAPIDLVLEKLSEAAGFIIQVETPLRGSLTVISSHPMTRDEAVDLLNTALNQNGYAAIRNGDRILRIMDKASAISASNPVKMGNNPDAVPNNDEMVTQIIPIRFVEASQLVSDLSPFVSPQARIIANQAGNSIVITDTQANIRHLMEIIRAIDNSAEDVTELRVFHLQYADPTEMANLLTSLFPDQTGTAQAPIRFGGRGGRGFPFGRFAAAIAGNAGGNNANSQSERIKKRQQVVAVADPRTSSVVVTATKDLMDQIGDMVRDLDFKSSKDQTVKVFHLNNADAQEILPVLQDMFQNNTTLGRNNNRGTSSTQNSPFQNRLQQYQNNNNSTTLGNFGTGTGNNLNRGGAGAGVQF
jgi:type II secretory pathway component GspD/PulD (secretin)